MNITNLADGFAFRGQVTAHAWTHFVFEADQFFFLLSCGEQRPAAAEGYFHLVDKSAVYYVRTRFAGLNGVTAMDVLSRAQRTQHVRSNLAALNIFFVLVATGFAEIEREGDSPELYVTVR